MLIALMLDMNRLLLPLLLLLLLLLLMACDRSECRIDLVIERGREDIDVHIDIDDK